MLKRAKNNTPSTWQYKYLTLDENMIKNSVTLSKSITFGFFSVLLIMVAADYC